LVTVTASESTPVEGQIGPISCAKSGGEGLVSPKVSQPESGSKSGRSVSNGKRRIKYPFKSPFNLGGGL
jgi:hypothetical protein